mmetsp:Transcript_53190/g.159220  ORF Transcript_53190/g.159220 Transcript_53190/m.159220 type:complete len:118 (+) Transcript_53190:1175-1528(+)
MSSEAARLRLSSTAAMAASAVSCSWRTKLSVRGGMGPAGIWIGGNADAITGMPAGNGNAAIGNEAAKDCGRGTTLGITICMTDPPGAVGAKGATSAVAAEAGTPGTMDVGSNVDGAV